MLSRNTLLPFALLSRGPSLLQAQKTPIQITADLTDAPRKLHHAEIDIPVIPAHHPHHAQVDPRQPPPHRPRRRDHRPSFNRQRQGPPLAPRRRRPLRVPRHRPRWRHHPPRPSRLHRLPRISQKLAMLEWEKLVLYPATTPVKDIPIQPTKVPDGWGIGTALTPTRLRSAHPRAEPPPSPRPPSTSSRTRPSSPASTSTNSRSPPSSRPSTTLTRRRRP